MVTVFDVAASILEKKGAMSAMKLQKLCYYSQAWALVWDDQPLFQQKIRAWANGPVVPELYAVHRGKFHLLPGEVGGDSKKLAQAERETVDAVLDFYGDKTAFWLSELAHAEAPWREAREGLAPGERGNAEITPAAMAEYYGGLDETTGSRS